MRQILLNTTTERLLLKELVTLIWLITKSPSLDTERKTDNMSGSSEIAGGANGGPMDIFIYAKDIMIIVLKHHFLQVFPHNSHLKTFQIN